MQLHIHKEMRSVRNEPLGIDVLWHACGTAEGLALWQADEVSGSVEAGETLNLSWPALSAQVPMRVVRVDAPREIVFASGPLTLQVEVAPGSVTLRQDGLSPGDQLEGMRSSWTLALALLAHGLREHPDRTRRASWFVRHTQASPEHVHTFVTDHAALGAWLTSPGSHGQGIGEVGAEVQLATLAGELSGRVLANSPGRDVGVSWRETRSALTVRTLPSPVQPGRRILAVVWHRWDQNDIDEAPIAAHLESAVQRLARALGPGREA